MIGSPPRSALFPYPPLFRSKMAAEEIRAPPAPSLYSRPARQSGGLLGGDVALGSARPLPGSAGSERREERGELPRRPRDRKSTRLNSSHANISYAVFCLKKK